ncbi:alpha/beta hydrolase family esterase [Solimonas sp. K1W22B-7]|uniref:alpha/beta hydrolase family esterase n=1 Tax=Solimonas sp. K1W22B-7 TaxID=2303331 RepID=UPI0013C46BB8|nr:hypothetical protein [Solimonas sp. K1W22B-7]
MKSATWACALLALGLCGNAMATDGNYTVGPTLVAPKNVGTVVKIHGNNLVLAAKTAAFDVTLTHNGLVRTFTVVRPDPIVAGAPLMLVLHGRGGHAEGQATITNLAKSVAAQGYWAVLPQYYDNTWDDNPGLNPGLDDVGFSRRILDIMQEDFGLNPARTYASGFSNGGFMTERLACELSDRVAAYAFVATSVTRGLYNACAPTVPRPVMFIHGTTDPIVPWAGNSQLALQSVDSAVGMWTARLGCGLNPTQSALPDTANDGTSIDLFRYSCGTKEVRLYRVNNGGHTWPGGSQYLPVGLIGKVSGDMQATDEIWNFVKAYQR